MLFPLLFKARVSSKILFNASLTLKVCLCTVKNSRETQMAAVIPFPDISNAPNQLLAPSSETFAFYFSYSP